MDIKYKIDWVPEAKKQRQLMTQKGPTGIGSKSEEVQDTDQGFYQTMYDTLKQYFSDNEEADKVLTSKEIDRDAITMEALNEFDSLKESLHLKILNLLLYLKISQGSYLMTLLCVHLKETCTK